MSYALIRFTCAGRKQRLAQSMGSDYHLYSGKKHYLCVLYYRTKKMKKKNILLLCGWIMLLSGCSKESPVDDADYPSVSLTEYEKEVIALVNKERLAAGLNALQIDPSLMVSCDVRAKEIVSKFSHTRPDGRVFLPLSRHR